jgi:histidyl-tRNA synthetase|tara:strand:+ start:2091 stop:3221 length:1131 start_codon:yes stop_codon:yes gene_type:complete
MKTENVKGFKDVMGNEAEKRALIKEVIKQAFESYGFTPAETPIIEYEEFVKGENPNDEAVRDIYKLKDRKKRKLALRYEFTFQLKRLAKNQKLPFRRYQIGPLFRDEPIRPGRTRQFTQCDADIVGSTLKDEAECFSILKEVLDSLKIKFTLYINNRKLINEILDKNNIKDKEEVIREIDKLDKLSIKEVKTNLKKYKAEKLLDIFTKKEKYFENYESYKEIKELKKLCGLFGVSVEFRPFLARGFSYYNGTVFEVWSKDLKVSVCGGGSYLINGIQSTGISFGLEPLILLTNIVLQIDKILIVSLNQDKAAIKLTQKLRKQGKNTTIFYGKPSKALEYANSYKIKKVIFVGEKEVKLKKFKIKNMKTGREKFEKL